jgi:hypothetical protein
MERNDTDIHDRKQAEEKLRQDEMERRRNNGRPFWREIWGKIAKW